MKIHQGTILYKIISLPGILILRSFDLLVSLSSSEKTIISSSDFPFIKELEKSTNIILNEYNKVRSQNQIPQVKDFYKVESDIGQDDNWKGFPFIIYNYAFNNNISQCPETYKTLKIIPGCTSAMFSILGSGKHILPHKGIYKGIIRGLFTISVPEGDCWIRIENNKIQFQKGKVLLFDETHEHEVLNATDGERVVLYFDMYRKLPFPLNLLNKIIFTLLRNSPFIKNIPLEYNKFNKESISEYRSELKPVKM